MAYEIIIRKTGKNVGERGMGGWNMFDREEKTFRRKKEAIAFLRSQYAKKRKVPMYQDTKSGQSKRVGTIFKLGVQRDWSHGDNNRWYQQDWVEMNKVRRSNSLFKL